jgi:SH3-like domain-containing protein
MRFRVRIILVTGWLLAAWGFAGWGIAARAQTGSPAGNVQPPIGKKSDKPAGTVPPPVAERKPASGHAGRAPVVPPHGPTHPHKPAAKPATVPVKPAPPSPPPEAAVESKPAEKLPDPEKPEGAPSRLPRFASLRSDDVNMRAGPGTRYRIDWVYKRRDLPVEIEREFDVWRWVRDADGIQGWVHQATLMGRRSFIVQKADATLRSEASDTAAAVAILKPGVIGRIRSCPASSDWCDVQTGSNRGYLRRTAFWGVLPDEAINP